MPHVGGKEFSYSKSGIEEAEEEAKKTGKPIKMKKSDEAPLFPVIEGQPEISVYTHGEDQFISDGIKNESHHVPPLRNLRAEKESLTGEATPE